MEYLCLVVLDLGISPGWSAAIVATYCQSRVVEHAKSKPTQPRYSATSITLYTVVYQRYVPNAAKGEEG